MAEKTCVKVLVEENGEMALTLTVSRESLRLPTGICFWHMRAGKPEETAELYSSGDIR